MNYEFLIQRFLTKIIPIKNDYLINEKLINYAQKN